jgi:membrane-associated protease RseP (regulator of RpoE activity)
MHCRYFAAGLALLIAAPAWGDDKPKDSPKPETSFEVPYKLTDTKHVMVRVKLNGKGPFNFILDTGAPALIMSETIGKKVGADIDKGGWGKYKLEVEGGVTLTDAKALAIDMFQLKGMNAMGVAGVELHGVIGYNILAKYRITYDFTKDKLVWVPLKFDPPEIIRINKDDGQGGLEMIGNMMKFLAPLLGLKPNFDVRPRGFLGIEGESGKACFTVLMVVPDSPADKAGIKKGDKIRSVGGKNVELLREIQEALAKHGEGEKVKVNSSRDDKSMDLDIELGKGL